MKTNKVIRKNEWKLESLEPRLLMSGSTFEDFDKAVETGFEQVIFLFR